MRFTPLPRLAGQRFRLSWPLLLLAASIGMMALAAFQAQSAVRSHQRTANRLLKEYAAFAAWSFQQHLANELEESLWEGLHPFYPTGAMTEAMHEMGSYSGPV